MCVALVVAACGSSTPSGPAPSADGSLSTTPDAPPTATAPAPLGSGDGALTPEAIEAAADPSYVRMASVERDLLTTLDHHAGLTDAIGPELQGWLLERRSVAFTAALEAAGIDPSGVGPTALSAERVAAADGGSGGAAWIGSIITGALALNAGMSHVGPGSGEPGRSGTFDSTETQTEGDRQVTMTVHLTTQLTVSGSLVVADADATETDTAVSVSTGARIGSAVHRTHIHAEATVCPDANGVVELRVEIEISTDGSGMPGGSSFNVNATTLQQGHVDDDAYLTSEDTSTDAQFDETSADGTTQSGSATTTATFTYGPRGHGYDTSAGVPSTGSLTGDMDPSEATGFLRFVQMTAAMLTATAFDEAQKQWRNGKCVAIEASEHSRKVGPNDVIQFTAQPVHKIDGGNLDKPVVATFSGEKSIDPLDTPVDAPAAFTFIASQRETSGFITLTSTSNRGIGTLALTFEVEYQGWFIDQPFTNGAGARGTITGKFCGHDPEGSWVASGTYEFLGFKGNQTWKITPNDHEDEGSGTVWTGPFTYRDDSKGPFGVEQHTRVTGTVMMTISDDDGSVTMTFMERTRKQTAKAPGGGTGSGPTSPQRMTDLTWTSDADC